MEDPMYAIALSLFLCAHNISFSDFIDQVEDGKIEIISNDLPYFLYQSGTIYNPDNEAAGLFRGFLLVRVSTYLIIIHYEHIFFPPGLSAYIYRSGFGNEPQRNRWNEKQGSSLPHNGSHRPHDCLRMHTGKQIFYLLFITVFLSLLRRTLHFPE
jgi:hypothetical protein